MLGDLILRFRNSTGWFARQWCSLFHSRYHIYDVTHDLKWGAGIHRRMCKRCRSQKLWR
jgi:hypothetical protein